MEGQDFSPLISNGMIMQRDKAFPLWSKIKLTAVFLNKTYESQQIEGRWLITLDPVSAGGPFYLELAAEDKTYVIQNIYAGDVWMCAGQSNMEMPMERLSDDYSEEWKNDSFPVIRQFKVPQECDFNTQRDEISGGSWVSPTVETLHEFSGAAWFFAKMMYEKHKVPIGLINTAWGGTPVETWMSKEALASYPEKIAVGEVFADAAAREGIVNKTTTAIQEWDALVSIEDMGLSEKWQRQHVDISEWDEITLPGAFADAGPVNFCGAIWLAKDFEVSENFAAKQAKIWLGTIIDADTVYVNGAEIGNTTYRYPPRKYVPADLITKGTNRIVIRVICNNGEGGITSGKPFKIFSDNETIELGGTWKYRIGVVVPPRPEDFFFQRQPMGNFNAMIAPVLKFPLKGVIWYQGESNDPNPNEYAKLFRLMIEDWREKNNNSELPFIFVQLPIFGEPSDNDEKASWAVIREAQASALSLPDTAIACALELGEWNDIHPLNKKGVGIRLFLAADKAVFKNDNTSPGPMLCRHEKRGNMLNLFFDNCGYGLTTVGGQAYLSVIDGNEKARLPLNIEGADFASVDLSSHFAPEKVLYAWADNPRDRQLLNSDGLPALPFKFTL
jgi:sialate O-acetylesterase